MTRRVRFHEWQRELRMVKAVQEGRLKMDLEPPGRIVKPAGTARYSSRVFMALSGVPVKSFSGDGGEKKSGNTVNHRLSFLRDDFFISKNIQGGFHMNIKTICIHGSDWKDPTGCISVPVFQSATFGHPELGESTGYDYTRVQNPTRESAEKVVAALEHGCDCTSYSSGMATISMVMELFRPGDTILSSDDLYGGSIRLFRFVNEKNGIRFKFVNTSHPDQVEEAFDETVKAVYIETPTNPMMQITDIRKTADIAHAHGALLIADNTFMSPYFCNPIDFGADIVIHSGTKYLAGHNDTLAGFVVVKDKEIADKLRFLYKTVGGCLAPWDSWLVTRGIKTLALRMEAAQKNAETLAEWLENHPKVSKVFYPGLSDFPGRDIHFSPAAPVPCFLSTPTAMKQLSRC